MSSFLLSADFTRGDSVALGSIVAFQPGKKSTTIMVVSHTVHLLCSPLPPVVRKSSHFPLRLGLDFGECTLAPLRVLL